MIMVGQWGAAYHAVHSKIVFHLHLANAKVTGAGVDPATLSDAGPMCMRRGIRLQISDFGIDLDMLLHILYASPHTVPLRSAQLFPHVEPVIARGCAVLQSCFGVRVIEVIRGDLK